MTSSASPVAGQGYAAGGIGITVADTRAASDKHLRATPARLVGEAHRAGMTAIETTTGYGLTSPTSCAVPGSRARLSMR